jgi:serine protease AprX
MDVTPRRKRRALKKSLIGPATAGLLSVLLATGGSIANASTVHSPTEQVIVRASAGHLVVVERSVQLLGGKVGTQLAIINGFVAQLSAAAVGQLGAQPGVVSVTPDAQVQLLSLPPTSEVATPTTVTGPGYDPTTDYGSLYMISKSIGAQQAWAQGITGKGVDVALLDTGVVPVAGLDEPGKVINGPDLSFDSQNPGLVSLDTFGHGTHMAGIIAGRDDNVAAWQYANPATWTGIAPDASIVNVKLGSADGSVDVSQIIAGIDWVVDNAHSNGLNIRVLNLSLGTTSTQPYTLDPLDYATEVAWRHGIVVVAAAGNDGTSSAQLADPADDPFVIAVGAENLQAGTAVNLIQNLPVVGKLLGSLVGGLLPASGSTATFNNTGTAARHVDLLAPGTHVISLRDPGSAIDATYPSAEVGTRFFRGSGTSQATAVVSGAAALLIQKYPSATPDQIKYMLMSSAQPLSGTPTVDQGAGMVQLNRALLLPPPSTAVSAQPFTPSTGLGTLEGARGGNDLTVNGVTLSGEQDIFGHAWSAAQWAPQAASAATWSGGTWNGDTWIGAWPLLWTGTAADGGGSSATQWTSLHWGGASWSDVDWASLHWGSLHWGSNSWG